MRLLLRGRYAPPEWALFEEVRNKTGYSGGQERYADAVAINLWPSRGLEVLGFEIKARRGDWIKELKEPSKSTAIQQYSDRWWIVAGGRNIVQPGELPPTWGLMVAHGNGGKRRLVCVQEAPKLEPKPLGKPFLLALLRRAAELEEVLKKGTGDANYRRGFDAGREDARRASKQTWEVQRLEKDLQLLRESTAQFEKASGVNLPSHRQWEWGNIGMAVRVVLKHIEYPEGHRQALQASMRPLEACLGAMKALDRSFALLEEAVMERTDGRKC